VTPSHLAISAAQWQSHPGSLAVDEINGYAIRWQPGYGTSADRSPFEMMNSSPSSSSPRRC